ncbi:hypothetical protein NDU88_007591 [Pleurodeles waltl]|uniref:Uncharacterized protein n=1 Tax=Pleurodeles waltl TaxID=8319 RepID=A0AAV7RVI1_PLEWA|nr:hypothetical protein NDU88_007591 [Pleurodeles waltl]
MLQAPNLTGGLRLRAEKRARLLGTRLAARPDCDPAADAEGAAVRDRRGTATHRHERCNAQSSTANIRCMSLAERIKLLRACRRAHDTAAPQCSTSWVLPLCALFMLDVIKFAIQSNLSEAAEASDPGSQSGATNFAEPRSQASFALYWKLIQPYDRLFAGPRQQP